MGMFDELHCDMRLPDGYNADGNAVFQTKDLERNLDSLRITSAGRLILEKKLFEEELNPQETEYTGSLVFTGIEGDMNGDPELWRWHEYETEVTDGQCGIIRTVRSCTGAELRASRAERPAESG